MTGHSDGKLSPAEIAWNYASSQLFWDEEPSFLEPVHNQAGGADWYLLGTERSLHTRFAYAWDRFQQDCVRLHERGWWKRLTASAGEVWKDFFRCDHDLFGFVTLSDAWTPLPESNVQPQLAEVVAQRQRFVNLERPPQVTERSEGWSFKSLPIGTGEHLRVPRQLVEVPEPHGHVPWFIDSAARLKLESGQRPFPYDAYQQGLGALTARQEEQVRRGVFNTLLDAENYPLQWHQGILSFRTPVLRLGRLHFWRPRGIQEALLDDLWMSFRPHDGALIRIGVSSASFNPWVANEPTLGRALQQIRQP